MNGRRPVPTYGLRQRQGHWVFLLAALVLWLLLLSTGLFLAHALGP